MQRPGNIPEPIERTWKGGDRHGLACICGNRAEVTLTVREVTGDESNY